MIVPLLAAALALNAAVDGAAPAARPGTIARPSRPHRPPPRPAPPKPAPEAEEGDIAAEVELQGDAAPADADLQPEPALPTAFDDPPTEEELQALGLAGLCSCCCVLAGLVGLVVFLVRRKGPAAAAKPPVARASPMPPAVGFHLSVLAVSLRAPAQQTVAQQLLLAGVNADPKTTPERTQLVRELAKALGGVEAHWSHFGYGERVDLPDGAAALHSYQLAIEDFTARSRDGSASPDAAYAVVTMVLCTRRPLLGVSALDDRVQIHALLSDRAALPETDVVIASALWSPPLGGEEVLTRFPEMHAVR